MIGNYVLFRSSFFQLIRVRQWLKNGFVFAPLIFSFHSLNWLNLFYALYAFVLFCFASSLVYVVNDLCDVASDRLHPVKCIQRPIASGAMSLFHAKIILGSLALIVSIIGIANIYLGAVVLSYILLNILYSLYLKHIVIVDLFVVALCFVLRVLAGAVVIHVPLSGWMFITTLSLALFLASAKRYKEFTLVSAHEARQVLTHYRSSLLHDYVLISATTTILFYSFFVLTQNSGLVFTIPLVLFGLYRFWFLVDVCDAKESPTEALVRDWPLIIDVLLWVASCGYIVHF